MTVLDPDTSTAPSDYCPPWCEDHLDIGEGRRVHSTWKTVSDSKETDPVVSLFHTVDATGGTIRGPAVQVSLGSHQYREQMTPDEAIRLGAALIKHGEQAKYEGNDYQVVCPEPELGTRWQPTVDAVADVLARIDMDRFENKLLEAATNHFGGNLYALFEELGLEWEYGFGARISNIIDHVIRDGSLFVGIEAALRRAKEKPDISDVHLGFGPNVMRSRMMADALEAAK